MQGHDTGMHQKEQVTVLILKTSSGKRASQWGAESWREEQGGTECALIPLYSLAFRVPLPDTIPLLHGLTSHLTREEHIGYITATKLELGLCRSQGGISC